MVILACLVAMGDKVRKKPSWVGGRGAVPLPVHRQELLGRSSSQRVHLAGEQVAVTGWIWEATAAIRCC